MNTATVPPHSEPTTPIPAPGVTRDHHRSLRSKLVLSVAFIFFALFMLHEMVRKRIINREFASLEQQQAVRDVNRVLSAIHDDVEHLSQLAAQAVGGFEIADSSDLAAPSDTEGTSEWWPGSVQSELRLRLRPEPTDWIVLATSKESIQWIQPLHPLEPAAGVTDFASLWPLVHQGTRSQHGRCSGIVAGPHDTLFMVTAVRLGMENSPSTHSELGAPEPWCGSEGGVPLVVLGRPLDSNLIDALRRRTGVPFLIERGAGDRSPLHDGQSLLTLRAGEDGTMRVVMPLVGLDSRVLGNLLVEVSRETSSRALYANELVRNYFLFGSVAALLSLLWLLQRIVVAPVVAIREHTERIAEQGLETEPLVIQLNDEIGDLAKAFDHMTKLLSDAQRSLSESSRAAGARQVADSVIHNIGNVLTNVNSLLDSANASATGLRVQPLNRLADRLETSADDREFLDATPRYLRQLADSLGRDQRTLGELLDTLGGNLRHIHDVIRAQRRHASQSIDPESLVLGELVQEAIDCCRATLERDGVSVQLVGELQETVRSDRSLLLQVFINVVGNAGDALRMKRHGDRQLLVSIEPINRMLRLSFKDNGVGIDRATLRRVFDAHFTTRASGSGLGLHFCALAVSRLGGDMRALSEGPGLGATFVIEVPRDIPAELPLTPGPPTPATRREFEVLS